MLTSASVRVGVVGCGYWGPKHLRVLAGLPDVASVAAIDAREERLAAVMRALPAVTPFLSLEQALPQLDALVVATQPSSHYAIASQAMEAGKHVLIEKPMTTNSLDGEMLVAQADAAGLVLMAGHTFEYNPAVVKLREIVQENLLGRIFCMDSARLNLGLYQNDVDVLFDLAPHDVSIFNFVLGATPTSVEAWGSQHAHHHIDVAYLRFRYGELGISANVHVSWLDPCKVRRVTVVGSRKMAVYDDLASDERIRVYDKGVVVSAPVDNLTQPPMSYRYGDIVAPYTSSAEPLAVQDQHFIDCIRTGATPQSDGRSGLRVVQALEGAQRSIALGQRVDIAERGTPVLAGAAAGGALR